MVFRKKPLTIGERTAAVLSLFTDAVGELTDINQEAESQAFAARTAAADLIEEADGLDALREQNTKVINNINAILA